MGITFKYLQNVSTAEKLQNKIKRISWKVNPEA